MQQSWQPVGQRNNLLAIDTGNTIANTAIIGIEYAPGDTGSPAGVQSGCKCSTTFGMTWLQNYSHAQKIHE